MTLQFVDNIGIKLCVHDTFFEITIKARQDQSQKIRKPKTNEIKKSFLETNKMLQQARKSKGLKQDSKI